jgi:hypothetical protein
LTTINPAEQRFDCQGHARRGLARADHDDALECCEVVLRTGDRQLIVLDAGRVQHCVVRIGRRQCGVEDAGQDLMIRQRGGFVFSIVRH